MDSNLRTLKTALPQTTCRRCGVCCRKGGPALHYEDKPLVDKGVIDIRRLFTIRKDEWVYDNVTARLEPARSEIIKIKGQVHPNDPQGKACWFFEWETNACAIYEGRPLECRLLKCWDVRQAVQNYNQARLTRKHILGHIEGLWELIADHQRQCSYAEFRALLKKAESAQGDSSRSRQRINAMIGYDKHLRAVMVQKSHLPDEALEFLLGRPLSESLKLRPFY